jgi:hypothetical protein
MLTLIGLTALLTLLTAASPLRVRTPYAVRESHLVPRKWSRVGPAPANHIFNLRIGLKQGNFNELERHLYKGMYTTKHCNATKILSFRPVTRAIWPASQHTQSELPRQTYG